ncbi:hypothetical protein [Nostoc sp. FACHB-145]|nr:hypothetical protein [Nostoc sp. FACHB-145]
MTVGDEELTVGVQYLRSFNYLRAECQQVWEICDRRQPKPRIV